jgi:hypothetical protein
VIGEDLPSFLQGPANWDTPAGGDVKKLMEQKGIVPTKITIPRRAEHLVEVRIRGRGAGSAFLQY